MKSVLATVICVILIKSVYNSGFYNPYYTCRNFSDYYNNPVQNKNCSFNPDVYMTTPQIILHHGYLVKTYRVVTTDGYILTVFRIPPRGGKRGRNNDKLPVFIQHGMGLSSIVFVDIGKKSLAFVLADQGYDVWLGNFRGSFYSSRHVRLSDNSHKYWNFSFHENGIYDLPAQFNLVTKQTRKKILFVGYSMGTTAYFIFNSELPEQAEKQIHSVVALAPMAFMRKIRTPITFILPFWPIVKSLLYKLTNGAMNQRTPLAFQSKLATCFPLPFQMEACRKPANLLFGYDGPQIDPETLPVVVMQDFDATAIKTFDHYVQLYFSGGFLKYNYNSQGNLRMYGSTNPPPYNLSNINVPIYLIRSDNDLLATEQNVEQLYRSLPPAAKPSQIFLVNYEGFSHSDFITGKDVKTLVYDHVIEILRNSTAGN